eukprot:g3720.t1
MVPLQLPLVKREAEARKMRPQTPDTRSPSSSGDQTTDEPSTPCNLWPATPTPTPRYTENISFMMVPVTQIAPCMAAGPPTRTRMNANAQDRAFIPSALSNTSECLENGDATEQGETEETVPNIGSTLHGKGQGQGHLCPAGALKERKKAKVAAIRSGVIAPKLRDRLNTV